MTYRHWYMTEFFRTTYRVSLCGLCIAENRMGQWNLEDRCPECVTILHAHPEYLESKVGTFGPMDKEFWKAPLAT